MSSDPGRVHALSTVRLSDHELVGLARLASNATVYTTGPGDYPGYDASPDERKAWEQQEEERRAEDARQRAAALAQLRQWVEEREVDAYLRGVDATSDREAGRSSNTRSIV